MVYFKLGRNLITLFILGNEYFLIGLTIMSRKRKRQVRRQAEVTNRDSTARRRARSGLGREFNPDYTYVIKDLRRIAILTGFFLVVLLVLAILIR